MREGCPRPSQRVRCRTGAAARLPDREAAFERRVDALLRQAQARGDLGFDAAMSEAELLAELISPKKKE